MVLNTTRQAAACFGSTVIAQAVKKRYYNRYRFCLQSQASDESWHLDQKDMYKQLS